MALSKSNALDLFKHLCNATRLALGLSEEHQEAIVVISREGVYAKWGDGDNVDEMRPVDISIQDAFAGYVCAPTGKKKGLDNTVSVTICNSWLQDMHCLPEKPTEYPVYFIIERYRGDHKFAVPMYLMNRRMITDAFFFLEASSRGTIVESFNEETSKAMTTPCKIRLGMSDDYWESRGQIESPEVVIDKMRHIWALEDEITSLERRKKGMLNAL